MDRAGGTNARVWIVSAIYGVAVVENHSRLRWEERCDGSVSSVQSVSRTAMVRWPESNAMDPWKSAFIRDPFAMCDVFVCDGFVSSSLRGCDVRPQKRARCVGIGIGIG